MSLADPARSLKEGGPIDPYGRRGTVCFGTCQGDKRTPNSRARRPLATIIPSDPQSRDDAQLRALNRDANSVAKMRHRAGASAWEKKNSHPSHLIPALSRVIAPARYLGDRYMRPA